MARPHIEIAEEAVGRIRSALAAVVGRIRGLADEFAALGGHTSLSARCSGVG
ncbi:hypothetical protein ACFVFS_23835 [Kitasatospora sp. NPDC057692]|uniref:hypothetical protein n=1 Tax=Kitasatospora sp. NPDC057692 TaxID=3346215 RepID=UPI00367C923E